MIVILFLLAVRPAEAQARFFGYYWGETGLDQNASYSNVMIVNDANKMPSLKEKGVKGVIIISDLLWDCSTLPTQPCNLRGDYQDRWNKAWNGEMGWLPIKDYINEIEAFYMADEPEMNTRFEDFQKMITFVKSKTIKPLMMIMTYEGPLKLIDGSRPGPDIQPSWLDSGGKLKVPTEVDWLGFDEYDCYEGGLCFNNVDLLTKYNTLGQYAAANGKKVMVIGDGYFGPTFDGNNTRIDKKMVNNWAIADWCLGKSYCVGMMVFLWKHPGLTGVGDVPVMETGMNDLGSLILRRGRYRIAGDADGDGKVTILDFARWRQEFVSKQGTTADFDNSGTVTILDFARWRGEFVK